MPDHEREAIRVLLCRLGATIRARVQAARGTMPVHELAAVARESPADTIFVIDRVGEEAVEYFLETHWPKNMPVEVVMEGIEPGDPMTHPAGTAVESTRWKLILDPIDGTRGLMYDKRPAWVLAAVAPQKGAVTGLSDLVAASMTELPVMKQDCSDQISAVRDSGRLCAERFNVRSETTTTLHLRPSQATDLRGGYAGFARFFPEGKSLTAALEERFLRRLFELGKSAAPLVFEDQYASTGGQIYELLAGRDRMVADLRPLVFRALGYVTPLACHPYDICTAMLLTEAGGVVTDPLGEVPILAPLDTTSAVAWVGFANRTLATTLGPLLREVLLEAGLGNGPIRT